MVRRTVDLNLTAAILCAREAVRLMSTSRGGSGGVVVNVSSGAATLGAANEYVQYAAAKAGWTPSPPAWRSRWRARGSAWWAWPRASWTPPSMQTRVSLAGWSGSGRSSRSAGRGARRVADAIGWLMSDQASYVTGTTLRVAGGR